MTVPDLAHARTVVELGQQAIGQAVRRLAELGGPERQQVFAYDLAHAAAGVATARAMLAYGARGAVEARLTSGFVADAVHDLVSKVIGREQLWGVDPVLLAPAHDFLFSEFDAAIGHHRRFDLDALRERTPPGCRVVEASYLDSMGILASLANAILHASAPFHIRARPSDAIQRPDVDQRPSGA